MKTIRFGLALSLLLAVSGTAQAQLVAAVLPSARAVSVGGPATAFATIINASGTTATGCSVSAPTLVLNPAIPIAATFAYQTTDPKTNGLVGTPNTPVDIPAGKSQTFFLSLTPTAPFLLLLSGVIVSSEIAFTFKCANTSAAPSVPGVNTLLLTATPTQELPDIVAVAMTVSGDGIVTVPPGGTGAFALAVLDLNPSRTTDSAVINVPSVSGLMVFVCETDPTTAQCLASPAQTPLAVSFGPRAVRTFSVFVVSDGSAVAFNPATTRLSAELVTAGNPPSKTLGRTSVAVRTQP